MKFNQNKYTHNHRVMLEQDRRLHPVRLGSYLAERKISKQKVVLNRIRSSQLLFQYQKSQNNTEKKKQELLKVIEKIIDDLTKKKLIIQNKVFEQLQEEEKTIKQINKLLVSKQKQKIIKDQQQLKQVKNVEKTNTIQLLNETRPKLFQKNDLNIQHFQNLISQIKLFEDEKEHFKLSQTISKPINNYKNIHNFSTHFPQKSTILKNSSSKLIKLTPDSFDKQAKTSRYQKSDTKESKVKFRQ